MCPARRLLWYVSVVLIAVVWYTFYIWSVDLFTVVCFSVALITVPPLPAPPSDTWSVDDRSLSEAWSVDDQGWKEGRGGKKLGPAF